MKIAVASEGRMVAQHFGHCDRFTIYEEKNGEIVMRQFIDNLGHKPGFLPNFLNDLGIQVIISGGMGGGAIEIFNEKGIEVVTGASGIADETVEKFIEGSLKSTGSICHEHQHSDSCDSH
jgi:predicted Fe-Mo cluster-binding NifX family protein